MRHPPFRPKGSSCWLFKCICFADIGLCLSLKSQGFATGNIDNDARAIRHFVVRSNGSMEFAVAQSFSKNFGLYGERVGALHVVARSPESAAKVEAKLKKIQRAEITSTPSFGAKMVATIVQDPTLREQWHQDLRTMSGRLQDMRKRLHDELTKRNTPGNWDHLLTDVGLRSTSLPYRFVATIDGCQLTQVCVTTDWHVFHDRAVFRSSSHPQKQVPRLPAALESSCGALL